MAWAVFCTASRFYRCARRRSDPAPVALTYPGATTSMTRRPADPWRWRRLISSFRFLSADKETASRVVRSCYSPVTHKKIPACRELILLTFNGAEIAHARRHGQAPSSPSTRIARCGPSRPPPGCVVHRCRRARAGSSPPVRTIAKSIGPRILPSAIAKDRARRFPPAASEIREHRLTAYAGRERSRSRPLPAKARSSRQVIFS